MSRVVLRFAVIIFARLAENHRFSCLEGVGLVAKGNASPEQTLQIRLDDVFGPLEEVVGHFVDAERLAEFQLADQLAYLTVPEFLGAWILLTLRV